MMDERGVIVFLDKLGFSDSIAGEIKYVKKAFEVAKAYLNSIECNHDQTDRTEGSL